MGDLTQFKKFTPLNVSSKFAICGLPIRLDTYKTCSFGCKYCFSNNRKIMEFKKNLQIADVEWLSRFLEKLSIYGGSNNFLETLVLNGYTWHCGGMSDPFQPVEKELNVTKMVVDIANKYDKHILFSTKSDTVYCTNIRPDLHTFQLSVTNINDRKDIEPNVPPIQKRYEFYKALKNDGFKVGIRVQPFIPGVTTTDIIDMFHDADNFTIEGLKLVPQNKEHKEYLLNLLCLDKNDFKQMGLLNLKPEIREKLYKPFISELEKRGMKYSIADNDMHHIGNNFCCCGDRLVDKSTTINNTYLTHKNGVEYSKSDVDNEINMSCVGCCKCNNLFTSNRQEGCSTVQEFYDKRFYRKTSPFSPLFLYRN